MTNICYACTKKLFTFGGFDVVIASNGLDGFKQAQKILPDLIILDVMLPLMNGFELLEKIKKDKTLKKIPIVMLTNLNEKKEIEAALAQGTSMYIVKNEHDPQKVFEMVKQLI